jgi:hypothetical protein
MSSLESEAGVQMIPVAGSKTNTQGLILYNNDFIIIAFSGTMIDKVGDFLADLQTDLKFFPDEGPGGGHVHPGFKEVINEVWDSVSQHLKRTSPSGQRLRCP